MGKSKGGIYLIRTRKPSAPLGLPIIGRHNGYVGLTSSYYHRERQHLLGGGVYSAKRKDWADLDPKFYRLLPLPNWRWLLELMEWLAIGVLCPVYNVKKQAPWNVRRIKPRTAERQAWGRAKRGPLDSIMRAAGRWAVGLSLVSLAIYVYANR